MIYTIPGVGAAISALLLVRMFQLLRTSEAAGVAIVSLAGDGKLYLRQAGKGSERKEVAISKDGLLARLNSGLEDKTPDRRIIYLKGDAAASNEALLAVLDIIRKADVDRVALVVVGEKTEDDPYQIDPLSFLVRLPGPKSATDMPRPNPLTLWAKLDEGGKISLNNFPITFDQLRTQLASIFRDREYNGVFREGSNQVEKAVFVSGPASGKYGDFVKLIDTVKGAKAEPIMIQMDGDVVLVPTIGSP